MSVIDILEGMPKKFAGLPMTCIGNIKIGGKATTARTSQSGQTWYAPVKYDHFSLTTLNRDPTGHLIEDKDLMQQLIVKYGDDDGKLRQIPIRVLSDDLDDIIQSAFVWYGGKAIGARSDGKTVTWFFDPANGKRLAQSREDPWAPEMMELKNSKGQPLFKVHSNFNCVIAAEEARWGGVYKFRTTSVISLRQLHASLLHLSQLTGGILVGMPLMMVVRPMQVAPEGKATTVHVVHVELRGGDMKQLQSQAMEMAKFRLTFATQIQRTTTQYRKLLAGPGTETDGGEIGEIEDEFAPGEQSELQTVEEGTPFGLLDTPDVAVTPAAKLPDDAISAPAETSTLPEDVQEPEGAANEQQTPPPDILPPKTFADLCWDLAAELKLNPDYFGPALGKSLKVASKIKGTDELTDKAKSELLAAIRQQRGNFAIPTQSNQ